MNNNFIRYLILTIFLLFVYGCQSLKDGLEGNKKSKSSEEFLVKKKDPLVLPPDFTKLPLPNDEVDEKNNNEFDLENVLKKNKNTQKQTKKNNSPIKNKILEKIKEN